MCPMTENENRLPLALITNNKMKSPKTLKIKNERTISTGGYVTLPYAALKDAHKKGKPVVAYIPADNYANIPVTAVLWRNQQALTDAFIKSEWLPHEQSYNGFMKTKENGYWLTQMKVTREDLVTFDNLPKYAQKAIELHIKRTGGRR